MKFVPSPTIPDKERPPITIIVPKSLIDGLPAGAYLATMETKYNWYKSTKIGSKKFDCSHCGSIIASNEGWSCDIEVNKIHTSKLRMIYICPHCGSPTYFDEDDKQIPAPAFGEKVADLPPDIEELYEEARKSMSANAPTAAGMCCRKILMNVAVGKEAKEGGTFSYYVDYLIKNNHVPKNLAKWLEKIKDKGNDANHKIEILKEEDAKELIMRVEMLLKMMYSYSTESDIV